jgi:hypothetical protein
MPRVRVSCPPWYRLTDNRMDTWNLEWWMVLGTKVEVIDTVNWSLGSWLRVAQRDLIIKKMGLAEESFVCVSGFQVRSGVLQISNDECGNDNRKNVTCYRVLCFVLETTSNSKPNPSKSIKFSTWLLSRLFWRHIFLEFSLLYKG